MAFRKGFLSHDDLSQKGCISGVETLDKEHYTSCRQGQQRPLIMTFPMSKPKDKRHILHPQGHAIVHKARGGELVDKMKLQNDNMSLN